MKQRKALSPRQEEIWLYLLQYRAVNGVSPSLLNIANGIGMKRASVFNQLETMKRKGWVRSMPGVARSLVPIEDEPQQQEERK